MSGSAHRGDHDVAFYEAAIEETRELGVTTAGEELPDDDGPLIPGRYLVQFFRVSGPAGAICWVHVGAFEKGSPLGPTVGPGTQRVPLSAGTVVAIEFHALTGYSDRVAAIMTSGEGTLFLTRVSSQTQKHESGA